MEIRRPYASRSIEELETEFHAQGNDFSVLSHLAQELSHRRTKRARSLLALVAARLAEFESEPDEPDLNDLEDTKDDEMSSDEGDTREANKNGLSRRFTRMLQIANRRTTADDPKL